MSRTAVPRLRLLCSFLLLLIPAGMVAAQPSPGVTVTIAADGRLDQQAVTVQVGSTVVWQNGDSTEHTVTSDAGLFDSGILEPGDSFTYEFDALGSIAYRDSLSDDPAAQGLAGVVSVVAAPPPTAQPQPPSGRRVLPAGNANLLRGSTVLASGTAGRVDWGQNGIVYSGIQNFSGAGELSSEIYVMGSDGTTPRCVTCGRADVPHLSNDQPAWSPDGNYILFQSADPTLSTNGLPPAEVKRLLQGGFGFNNNLWLIRADGSGTATQLTHVSAGEATLHPHFSADGSMLLWSNYTSVRRGGVGWELLVANVAIPAGGQPPYLSNVRSLTPLGKGGTQVYEAHDLSPDRHSVLYSYSAGQPLDLDIYQTDLTTGQTVNLTNSPGVWDEHAHYSPDGQRIAWVSSRGYPFTPQANWEQTLRTELWMMNADGSDQQQVTNFNGPPPGSPNNRFILADLAWSPDGTSLVAAQSRITGATSALNDVRVDFQTQAQ